MQVSAALIKELRERTGAGVMDCKQALTEAKGDLDRAEQILKEKGLEVAQAKADRLTGEGVVDSYIHAGSRLGVLVEVNCETDFVARNDEFKGFVHDLAMHVAAAQPLYVTRDDVPAEEVKSLPDAKKEDFFRAKCLTEQPFIKDESVTIGQLLTDLIAKIGENMVIRRFCRFKVGE